jgi:hypothetical protein
MRSLRANPESPDTPKSPPRRRFLRGIGAAGGGTIATAVTGIDWMRPRDAAGQQSADGAGFHTQKSPGGGRGGAVARRDQAFQHRMHAALVEKNVPMPPHPSNGDEALYQN